jgi:Delta3-Delta2-enoyl-CoA isomerase
MSTLRIEARDDVAILRMDKARANAIDEPFLTDLAEASHELAADPSVKGVLLASSHPKVFSPGLDLTTLIEFERPAMESFMMKFAAMVWSLYGFPKPLVAAVGGHAVAGGCILALTADYRVLKTPGAQMGLNEVKVGVPLPWSVAELLRSSVSPSALARIALLGRNFAGDDALAVGIVDELAPAEGFEGACLARLGEFVEKDPAAFSRTKANLRQSSLASMRLGEKDRLGEWIDCWFSESTQARIRKTVEALKKKA